MEGGQLPEEGLKKHRSEHEKDCFKYTYNSTETFLRNNGGWTRSKELKKRVTGDLVLLKPRDLLALVEEQERIDAVHDPERGYGLLADGVLILSGNDRQMP